MSLFKFTNIPLLKNDAQLKKKKKDQKKKSRQHFQEVIIIIIINALKGVNAKESKQNKKNPRQLDKISAIVNFVIYPSNSSRTSSLVFSPFQRDKFQVGLGGKCLGSPKKFLSAIRIGITSELIIIFIRHNVIIIAIVVR